PAAADEQSHDNSRYKRHNAAADSGEYSRCCFQTPIPCQAGSGKRRSLFGTRLNCRQLGKLLKQQRKSTGEPGLTDEIIFEDVQKAKELFGFRQKSTGLQQLGATEMATTCCCATATLCRAIGCHPADAAAAADGSRAPDDSQQCRIEKLPLVERVFAPPIALTEDDFDEQKSAVPTAAAMVTLPRRRSHRHRRASSDLVSDAPLSASSVAIDAAAASTCLLTARSPAQSVINQSCQQFRRIFFPFTRKQQQQLLSQSSVFLFALIPFTAAATAATTFSSSSKRRVARFWELKRLLVELTKRKADKNAVSWLRSRLKRR
uniref:Uncharacterized protein n=1 Tax=Macrostomum lignano TaxID=282301 RepID=A0A1I8FL87_9PLAT